MQRLLSYHVVQIDLVTGRLQNSWDLATDIDESILGTVLAAEGRMQYTLHSARSKRGEVKTVVKETRSVLYRILR